MRWRKLALAGGGLAAGLLAAEIALRAGGVGFPLPYLPDEYIGTRLQPGFSAWFRSEGAALVEVNAVGFRDRDHGLAKPAGTLRIAVLGDSYAEAVQVPREQTFWALLEEQLGECSAVGGRQVEVLNFGISGFGTAQELLTFRHYARHYQPDIVLLAFVPGNDVRNNSRRLEPVQVRPFFEWDGRELRLDAAFREHPDFVKARSRWVRFKVGLINRSRLLQLVNELKTRRGALSQAGPPGKEAGLDDRVLAPPGDAVWTEAWNITERLLARVNAEVRAAGGRLVVVVIGSGAQVHPDETVRAALGARLGVADLSYADARIAALGRREGFPVLLLSEPMRARAVQRGTYFHGFQNTQLGAGHWNAAGHRAAADLIAEELCEQFLRHATPTRK